MKKRILVILFIAGVLLTSCTSKYEKAMNLFDDRDYDEAVEILQELVTENKTDYDSWFAIVDAQIEDEEYDDAEETLEDLYDVIEDNFDLESEEVDYEDIVDDFQDYIEDIKREEGEIGKWYLDIEPQVIDLYDYNYMTYGIGDKIVLPTPEQGDIYYNLNGKKVKTSQEKYEDGIALTEEGSIELTVAVFNEFGMKSEESYAYISVVELPNAPVVNIDSGTYEGPISLKFENYDAENGEISYSLDGTDPYLGMYYWYDEDITLYAGEYTLRAVYYDYNTYTYSNEFIADYVVTGIEDPYYTLDDGHTITIEDPNFNDKIQLNMVVYGVSESVNNQLEWAVSDLGWSYDNIEINLDYIESLTELQMLIVSGEMPDVVYTTSKYISSVYPYISDVSQIVDIEQYEYYESVIEACTYEGSTYCLPVVVKPSEILFYNELSTTDYYDEGITWDKFVYEIDRSTTDRKLAYPLWNLNTLVSVYQGFGGEIVTDEKGNLSLDYDVLVSTLIFYRELVVEYGISSSDLESGAYGESFKEGDATFIGVDPSLYFDDDFSWDYYPSGLMPLPNGNYVKPILKIEGLIINKDVEGDSDKETLINMLYEAIAYDVYYNSSIVSNSEGMPAIPSIIDEYSYYSLLYLDTYNEIINMCSAYPNAIIEGKFNEIDIYNYIIQVMEGTLSPEEGANHILSTIESIY